LPLELIDVIALAVTLASVIDPALSAPERVTVPPLIFTLVWVLPLSVTVPLLVMVWPLQSRVPLIVRDAPAATVILPLSVTVLPAAVVSEAPLAIAKPLPSVTPPLAPFTWKFVLERVPLAGRVTVPVVVTLKGLVVKLVKSVVDKEIFSPPV